jgi:hypothetical protein
LQIGLVEEIQNLLGAEAIEDLDFEALETAVRHRVLRIAARALEQRFNSDTSDAVSDAQHPAPAAQWRVMWTAAPSAFKPFSAI